MRIFKGSIINAIRQNNPPTNRPMQERERVIQETPLIPPVPAPPPTPSYDQLHAQIMAQPTVEARKHLFFQTLTELLEKHNWGDLERLCREKPDCISWDELRAWIFQKGEALMQDQDRNPPRMLLTLGMDVDPDPRFQKEYIDKLIRNRERVTELERVGGGA